MSIRQLWIGSTGPYLFDRDNFVPSTDGLLEIYQAPLVFELETGEIITVDEELGTLAVDVASKEDALPVTPANPSAKFLNGNRVWSNAIGDGTNQTAWGIDGHQTMEGDARPWRDELTDAINIRSTGSGVSINSTEGTLEFTSTAQIANDYAFLNIQLNHDKDLTSSIYPHMHFFQGSNAVPNFLLQYRWQINGGEKVTSWTLLKCNTLAFTYSGTTKNNIAYSAAITPPVGAQLSDIVQFRLCRDTDNDSGVFTGNDPYTGTVGIIAFDVHFMINSLGSNTEYSK